MKAKLNNLPSGSNVVSSTKLKEGRARDTVAMVTTTRQMNRPQLTMVTVPIPSPLPYLHVDVNPICTLPPGAWTACSASAHRGLSRQGAAAGLAAVLRLQQPLKERDAASQCSPPQRHSLGPTWGKTVSRPRQRVQTQLLFIISLGLPSSPWIPRCAHQMGPQDVRLIFLKEHF